ncbi:MAG: HetP family heterocyst commitment protein [Leptolyngbya sp. Prado105]|jgi:hypothetical protein|nr:HetP family heterocyst commitment protein [Leptolyngbya sp. Prado105]
MTQQNPYFQNYDRQDLDRKMTSEEFTQVIAAISEGKYSWACVLILRIAGYNPLHYIPYRTYNRLVKDNLNQHRQKSIREKPLNAIEDLDHLEAVNQSNVRGGSFQQFFTSLRRLNF